jgi:hypothetical protein
MNVYFLVEGRRCERKLYPSWLSVEVPHLRRIDAPRDASENTYFLISGEGYPSILHNHLPNAMRDVEDVGVFDFLVIVLDADDVPAEERVQEALTAAQESGVTLTKATLEVVVQNRCIETWLLGNKRMFSRHPQDADLVRYSSYYNVQADDPELMPVYPGFNTHAQFHCEYLKCLFRERRLAYTKTRPGHAADKSFLEQLKRRVTESPGHLSTFSRFLALCRRF